MFSVKNLKKSLLILIAFSLFFSLLAACGEEATPTATPEPAPATTEAVQVTTIAATSVATNAGSTTQAASLPLSGTITAPAVRPVTGTLTPGSALTANPTANVTFTGTATSNPVVTEAATALPPAPTPTIPAGTPLPASTAGVPPSPTAAGVINPELQILNMAAGDPNTLDPALVADVGTAFFIRQLYSGLLTLDNNLKVVPDLAKEMPIVTENGTLYTFKLREGVKFHSGRELTADDIKYTLERAADPKLAAPEISSTLPANTYMTDIVGVKDKLDGKATEVSGVRVLDKYTLSIKLDAQKPQFLAKMTYPVFYVVNQDVISKGFERIDGTGPFKLAEYKRSQLLRFERNPDYYLGAPRLKQVNVALGANAANGLVLYEQSKIDLTLVGGADVERALDKASPLNRELVVKPQLSTQYVAFNNRLKPFDDPKIRQAFSLVVDRPRIARAMFEGKVQPANSILPPGLPGFSNRPGSLGYDVSRARDLIAQSSYRSPQNLPRITLHTTGDGLGRVLQEVYRQAFGIEVEVRQYDYQGFQSGLASARQFQMYIYGWVADYPDPDNFLRALLGSGSAFNDVGYSNLRFDDMLKQADGLGATPRRLEMYADAEQMALSDAPLLPVYHDISYYLLKPYVKGLEITQQGIWSLKDAYILK
jgi:oligopeptide transport system substrate-binding protein